jgi:hypothetical protein
VRNLLALAEGRKEIDTYLTTEAARSPTSRGDHTVGTI